jgi:hypothetical protein
MSLLGRVAEHPLAFFPVLDGGPAERFIAARPGYSLTLGQSSLVLTSHTPVKALAETEKKPAAEAGGRSLPPPAPPADVSQSVRIDFVGADAHATLDGQDPVPGYANFFTGNDPATWRRHVSSFSRVQYKNLYPGIDLIYYGEKQGRLEYDLVVAPGADPQAIKLHVSGTQAARIGAAGELQLDGPNGVMRLDAPVLYQTVDTRKRVISGHFVQLAENEFGFRATGYDKAKPLIIDPTIHLVYATYAGGIHDDEATDLVLDASGAAYVTGYTASQDFPVSSNAVQTVRKNIGTYTYDAFVMKFDASGNLIFSTFLGGNGTDQSRTVQLDSSGNVYIAGYTQSSDFPVTSNAYQSTFGGNSDAFLAKFSNDGSQLLYSTYLGGSGGESINRMKVNADGSFWVVGDASADGLPVSSTAFQKHTLSTADGFAAKMQFDAKGNLQIPALTFMGGSNTSGETGLTSDLDVDSSGNLYVTGATQSADYPVTSNAYEKPFPLSGGCYNSPMPNEVPFITKFSPDLSQMLYSTVVGGHTEDQNGYPVCNQYGKTIHVDPATGNIWLVGSTGMSDFPVTSNAISKMLNTNGSAGVDTFVFELSADGQKQLYGTYLGGSQFDYGGAAAWDASNNIWIAGPTQSTDYPVTSNALQPANAGGYDTFVTELSSDGTKILYATYLGGSGDDDISSGNRIRIDPGGNIHLAGETSSTNYPVTGDAFQSLYANGDQNPDTADAYYTILGTGAIGTIGPVVGGNGGDTTLSISGAGFEAGATCAITMGGTTLKSTFATVNATGTAVTCTFNLNGATIGSYDVSVVNPDGSSFVKAQAFNVETSVGPQINTMTIGRPEVRIGVPTTFTLTVQNTGDQDAYFTRVWIGAPMQQFITFAQGLANPFAEDNDTADYSGYVTGLQDADGNSYYAFLVPHLAAGDSTSLEFQLTVPDQETSFDLETFGRSPWFSTLSDAQNALNAAASNPAGLSATCIPNATGSLNNCLGPYLAEMSGDIITTAQQNSSAYPNLSQTNLETFIAGRMLELLDPTKYSTLSVARPGASAQDVEAKVKSGVLTAVAHPEGGGGSGGGSKGGSPAPGSKNPLGDQPLKDIYGEYWNQLGKNQLDYLLCWPNGAGKYTVIHECTCANDIRYTMYTVICTNKLFGNNGTYSWVDGESCAGFKPKKKKKKNNSGSGQLCSTGSGPGPALAGTVFHLTHDIAVPPHPQDGESCSTDPNDDGDGSEGNDNGGGGSDGCSGSGGSIDPNYKVGPFGDATTAAYIPGSTPLNYNVGFENEATATLPAANVVVTDQLDPAKVDLSTLTLGTIVIGTNIIPVPAGLTSYNTTYPLSSTLNVRIAGSLNTTSGLLKWTFTSIDPTTNLPPTDPTAGFLPPDTDGIIGQASVLFSVMPKSGQTTGAVINNSAQVVFDANAAIVTKTWTNTLDVNPPASSVTALPVKTLPGAFTVAWSGTDVGSGIGSFTIYVSDNGGPYTVFQQSVITSSASYTGVLGHTYAFYSIATDAAGNVEAAKTAPDTSTTIVSQLTPLSTTTSLTASSSSVASGGSVTLTATVTPSGSMTTPTGTITFMNGMMGLGVVSLDATGKASLTTTSLPVGTDSLTASYGGDSNYAGSVSTAVPVAVGMPTVQVSLSPSALTITNGSSGTTTVTIASAFGFSSAATLSCSGLPASASCSFSPTTVTPSSNGSVTSVLSITTASRASLRMPDLGGGGKVVFAVFFPLLLTPWMFLGRARRSGLGRLTCRLLLGFLLTGASLLASGCGGGGPITTTHGTPAGTSTVTVTATSGSVSQSATLTLTVN